ncbi:hypothetical protein JXI42_12940 [bacterium]|nr:hypothetical protein [bacterium]
MTRKNSITLVLVISFLICTYCLTFGETWSGEIKDTDGKAEFDFSVDNSQKYGFLLEVPEGVDFDLYLFEADGSTILKSLRGLGEDELIRFSPTSSRSVKLRVYSHRGAGKFVLTAGQRQYGTESIGPLEFHSYKTRYMKVYERCEFSVIPEDCDLDVEVMDPKGRIIDASKRPGSADENVDFTVLLEGVYTVKIISYAKIGEKCSYKWWSFFY